MPSWKFGVMGNQVFAILGPLSLKLGKHVLLFLSSTNGKQFGTPRFHTGDGSHSRGFYNNVNIYHFYICYLNSQGFFMLNGREKNYICQDSVINCLSDFYTLANFFLPKLFKLHRLKRTRKVSGFCAHSLCCSQMNLLIKRRSF